MKLAPESTNTILKSHSGVSNGSRGGEKKLPSYPLLLLFLISVVVFPLQAQAQSSLLIKRALYQLERNPEIYLSIPAHNYDKQLSQKVSLDYIHRNRAFLYVNRQALEEITSRGISFRIEQSPGSVNFNLNMKDVEELMQKDLSEEWNYYPTYEAYVAMMYKFESDYPDRVKIHKIGTTVMGRDLLFAQIKGSVDQPPGVPQFMYTSTMHGDEVTGFVLSLRLIYHLISNYGQDDEITDLLNRVEIWICPNENPDGTYRTNNSTVSGATRSNANGKDLNRNYPGPHPSYQTPPEMPIQPETQSMIDFVSGKNFTMSANMHGGIEVLNFPWDAWLSSQNTHADHAWWRLVSRQYADTVHKYAAPGYMTARDNGITHGGDWYVIYGSRQDYMNYYQSCRELTLELSNLKIVNPSLLPDLWEYNYRSLIHYIRQATLGLQGVVKASATEEPLFALVELKGHDRDNSQVSTSLPHGNFSRPLYEGTYDVSFSSDGYSTVTMPGLKVENFSRINLTVMMADEAYPLYVYTGNEKGVITQGAGIYPLAYNVTLMAEPEKGYRFSQWVDSNGSILGSEQEMVFTMPSSALTIFAHFDLITTRHLVTFSAGRGNGQITASVDNVPFVSGSGILEQSDVVFVATPAEGYHVESWTMNGTLLENHNENKLIVKDIDADINVEVHFARTVYQLTLQVDDPVTGTVTVDPGQGPYFFNDRISLTAIPSAGSSFDSWTDQHQRILSSTENWTFYMPATDMDIKARFRLLVYAGSVSDPGGVKIYPNPAHSMLNVESDFRMKGLEVVDENGRVIHVITVDNQTHTSISLAQFVPGLYLLRIHGGGETVMRKFQVM
jgi:hypothetical protein